MSSLTCAERPNISPAFGVRFTALEADRNFNDYAKLIRSVFYLDGTIPLDSMMRKSVCEGQLTTQDLRLRSNRPLKVAVKGKATSIASAASSQCRLVIVVGK